MKKIIIYTIIIMALSLIGMVAFADFYTPLQEELTEVIDVAQEASLEQVIIAARVNLVTGLGFSLVFLCGIGLLRRRGLVGGLGRSRGL